MTARISSLHIYPIKACRGISLSEAKVERSGLASDRRYMIVDEEGVFVSQRTEPRLCLVSTELTPETITVHANNSPLLEIPLTLPAQDKTSVSIWQDTALGVEWSAGSAWFSAFLGRTVSLVSITDQDLRTVNQKYAAPGDRVGFADAFPVLAIGLASLEDLKSRLEPSAADTMTMDRFRPNVCIEGLGPFEEDELSLVSAGGVSFHAPKLCDRCVVTTINPKSGEAGREPLRTLAQYRKWDGAVWFGVNWIPQNQGILRVGDALRVERRVLRTPISAKSESD